MQRPTFIACLVCAAVTALPALAQSTGPAPVFYTLAAPPSEFEWGCFGPCECPVIVQSQIAGTFVLVRSHMDPLFTYYDVSDVQWKIHSGSSIVTITGSGTYRRGGEVAAQEQLALDLAFDGGAPQHFDSGLRSPGAAFPEIRTQLSLHGAGCFDSLLTVDARPSGTLAVDGGVALLLAIGPNPSTAATDISFALPGEGIVDLGVFDLAGRKIRTLLAHAWLSAGAHAAHWDGGRDDGQRVAPGLYLVRLETPAGTLTRSAMRTR